jgi:hypothetical protein
MKTSLKNSLFLLMFIFITINAVAEEVTYQAEDFGILNNRFSGYTGTGYHKMGLGMGDQLSVNKINEQGYFTLIVRYSMAEQNSQSCNVTINDENFGDLYFPSTESQSKWSEITMDYAVLDWETNIITFEKTSSGAALNIDSITLVEQNGLAFELIVQNGSGDGIYNGYSEVKITAAPAPAGMVFDCWEILNGTSFFDNPEASQTYIHIQDSDVEVIAVYSGGAETYNLVVRNGSGDGKYSYNELVYIIAAPAPAGMVFDCWKVINGDADIKMVYRKKTYLHMPANDVKVMAKYRIKN